MNDIPETLILPPLTLARAGALSGMGGLCDGFGPRGMIVHGRSLRLGGLLEAALAGFSDRTGVLLHEHEGGEPTLDQVERAIGAARAHRTDWVAAVGGGSVMDIGKACAGLLRAPLGVADYHAGAAIPPSPTPFVAAPTTAGTGSEATIVSVLTDARTGTKKSIRHPSHMPRAVILDPALLAPCPPAVLAASGLDAFTQAVESFLSRGATRLTDRLSCEAAALMAENLLPAFRGDRSPRRCLSLLTGSYLAGLALSHARLGVVHGLAHPLGSRYHQPHGLVCAVCLPHALRFNRGVADEKYRRLGEIVGADLLEFTHGLLAEMNLRSPFAGRTPVDMAGIVRETLESGSTAANPRPVTAADVEHLLNQIFGG